MNPEAQLPIVYQTAANLYQTELFSLQIQGAKVTYACRHSHTNTHTFELKLHFPILSYDIILYSCERVLVGTTK